MRVTAAAVEVELASLELSSVEVELSAEESEELSADEESSTEEELLELDESDTVELPADATALLLALLLLLLLSDFAFDDLTAAPTFAAVAPTFEVTAPFGVDVLASRTIGPAAARVKKVKRAISLNCIL